ncbi:MAG: lipopolysaccharide biosynthesis protein [Steroidobacteraceae bacterium]
MASGALWMILARLADRSIGLLSTLILARLLVPHDFGVVAMAMTFVALIEAFSALGLDTTLIQKQTKERTHWDTAWTFEILVCAAVALLLIAGSGPVASFFREPALERILPVLAIGSFAMGFQNIGVVAFRSEMRFDREFRFILGKKLIGFAVTIPLAIILESYWALVIGQTAGRFGATALSYWVHPYRPRLSLAATRDLFGFSKWLLVISMISYLKERSSDWIIGRLAGPASLGAFNVSYDLASLPSSELAAPINRAVFPAYAKLASQGGDGLRTEYLSVIGMIVLIAVPAMLGMAAVAPVLVPVLLGPNWGQAVPILMVLGFYGFTNIVQGNAQSAYLALGRPKIPAVVNGVHVIVQITAVVLLTRSQGVVGAAIAYLATGAIMIPFSLGIVLRMLRIRLSEFLAQVWRPVLVSAVMYILVFLFVRMRLAGEPGALDMVLTLLLALLLGVVIYVSGVALLWFVCARPPGAERVMLGKALQLLARLGWRPAERPT